MTSEPVVSGISTGGAGTIYEYRVAALVLAALLRGDRVPGLNVPITHVDLQQRNAGLYLDDVIASAADESGTTLTVEFQVKRTLSPTRGDSEWISVITQCLKVVKADREGVARRHHLLGLAAPKPVNTLTDLEELTRWVGAQRESAPAIRMMSRKGEVAKAVRDRWVDLRGTIIDVSAVQGSTISDDEANELAYLIAGAMVVWIADADDGGRDHREALNRLGDLVPPVPPDAAEKLFQSLAALAEKRGPRTGGFDVPALRAALAVGRVRLRGDPRHALELEALGMWTGDFLDRTRDTVAGTLHLERADATRALATSVAEHTAVVLSGRAGVGKSALARRAARSARADGGCVLALSLTERTWRTLADLEGELHVRLGETLACAPTTGPLLVVIDGAEQCLTDGGALLRSVLRTVPRSEEGIVWHLVATARDEAASAVVEIVAAEYGRAPKKLPVGDLADGEVQELIDRFPVLRPLDRHPRPRRLLRRPYLVDLLVRAAELTPLPAAVLAEEDVADLVFERIVRLGEGSLRGRGAPDDRADIYLAMAEAVLAGSGVSQLRGTDGEARQGMVSDDVLERERAEYRLVHDVLVDYAVSTRLASGDGRELVASAAEPRRILRAIRLWMQQRLSAATASRSAPGTEWSDLLGYARALTERDGRRWSTVPYEALVNLGPVDQALRALSPALLEHDGAGLGLLIEVTNRQARTAGASASSFDTALTGPIVGFLADLEAQVPSAHCKSATILVLEHVRALAQATEAEARGLLPATSHLPSALVAWSGRSWEPRLRETAESLGILAAHLDEDAERFLIESMQASPFEAAHAIEPPPAARAMARHRPKLLRRLAESYYLRREPGRGETAAGRPSTGALPPRRGRGGDESGVREHLPHRRGPLAHPDYGPFAALLAADPVGGLRLIGAVVDAATDARIRAESREIDRELRLELALASWPAPRIYRGTVNVWSWYRGRGVGDYPAFSALMALRAWGAGRIACNEEAAGRVVDEILGAGGSLGLVAVAFSLLVGVLEVHGELLHPFLAHPLVWQLETGRMSSLPALAVSDAPRIDQDIESVAMDLTLVGDEAQCLALQEVGRLLISRSSELEGPCGMPQLSLEGPEPGITYPQPDAAVNEMHARKWAAILDGAAYTAHREPDGRIAVFPGIEPELAEGLAEAGGRRATAYLEITQVTVQAIKYCNEQADGPTAAEMHRTMTAALDELTAAADGDEARVAQACTSAVAAALLIAPERGEQISDQDLAWAAGTLLDVADPANRLLPSAIGESSGQLWEIGADRSAAAWLPRLLLNPQTRQRAGTEAGALADAILACAASTLIEVRQRLIGALAPAWSTACTENGPIHDTAEAALRRMLATSGLGPRNRYTLIHPPVGLLEPLPEAILDRRIRFKFGLVAPAITGLAAAAGSGCGHGQRAGELLEALAAFDIARWPEQFARERTEQHLAWRNALDRYNAERILDGDLELLGRYLRAFAPVAEQLAGLLAAIAKSAISGERVGALEDLWPSLMDALLPATRQIVAVADRRPHEQDLNALDIALLPLPPKDAPWPTEMTNIIVWRWVHAYEDCPHLADHLIDTLNRGGWLGDPEATRAILLVLGTDPARIKAGSRSVVAWLRFVFDQPSAIGDHRPVLQLILDDLVTVGLRRALILQSELEV